VSTVQISDKARAEAVRYIEEPMYWARKFGGDQFDPWSGQEEFWREYGKLLAAKIKKFKGLPLNEEEKRYARKMGISIRAGQGLGKGATLSLAALHYMFALQAKNPKVVCTAPAGPQLHSSLWPEFGAWLSRNPFLGEIFEKNAKRIFLKEDKTRGNVSRIEPRTVQPNAPPEDQKVVLAGVHALGVLYLIDEASGVPEAVFEPIEGGLTDPLSMVFLIFNPTKSDGFAMETHRKNRDMWICLHWDGEVLRREKLQPENYGRFNWFNEDIQIELGKKYGKDSDFYRVRVKGEPPQQAGDSLIHFDAVMQAAERNIEIHESDPLVVGVDVGGPERGGDPSVVIPMRGPKVLAIHEYREMDGTAMGRLAADHLKEHLLGLPTSVQWALGVDVIGIGRSVYDHLRNIEKIAKLYRIDVSNKPIDENGYHRLRDQIYWELREAFMTTKEIAIWYERKGHRYVDDELVAELTTIKWREVDGKTKVQGKGESSGIPHVPPLAKSPNKADALAMAWYLYKHCCSRMPAGARQRRVFERKRVSWKAM
jgi:phage terminase large subunit